MPESRLEYLFNRYMSNQATVDEEKDFLELVQQPENKDTLHRLLNELITQTSPESKPSPEAEKAILQAIFQARQPAKVVPMKKFRWRRWIAAAAIIVIIGAAITVSLLTNKKAVSPPVAQKEIKRDVPPGKEGAILTLADNTTIVLDSAGNGQLAQQGSAIIKKNGSQVSYLSSNGDQSSVVYNTMSTPKGRTFTLNLSDGSKATLNAGSSIRFPSAFVGNERKVETTGEVFFDVAKDASKPFRVVTADMTIEVLGTHFNVNSYSDESSVTTTLVEGAVKIIKGDKIVKLTPGQQSVLDKNGNLSVNKDVNIDETIAWKEGYFHFESADLPTILRQFARWYDVQVSYEGQIPKDKFFVIVNRNSPLSSVLKALQASEVKFKIEGTKLIVQS